MATWPYRPAWNDQDGPGRAGATRMLNLMVPVVLPDVRATVHMILPEAEARQIANMNPVEAQALGEFFQLIKDGIVSFLDSEG